MIREGIRVSDLLSDKQNIDLPSILNEINQGESYFWSVLNLYAMGNLGIDKPIPEFEESILMSPTGYCLEWNELKELAKKFDQIFDIVILGTKDKSMLHHYTNNQIMYETCEIAIVMHDSYFWELFSIDLNLIDRWAEKFYSVERIHSDCLQ